MDKKEKYNLITRDLQEVSGDDVLKKILEKRDITLYWGTAPTAGCKVKILLADVHAFLDNLKAPIEKIEHRVRFYKKIITAMLNNIDVSCDNVEFVEGSSYQKRPGYFFDLQRILSVTNENDAKRAGCEVVKQVSDANISSLVYPAMQALDEEYLGVDAQFGGVDQRKIFMYAREFMPSIKYKKRIHLMNPMIPGLTSGKMSSSDRASKIDLLDTEKDIREKIHGCPCNFSNSEDGLRAMFRFIIFPFADIKKEDVFVGGTHVENREVFERMYGEEKFAEIDVKECATLWIQRIVNPVRETMYDDISIIKNAYE